MGLTSPPCSPTQSPPTLPPCSVCGSRASGFHYGANTCEACKGFFRRCLVREGIHKCKHTRYCETLPGRKHACPGCRYKRCIQAGMSREGIKTGRYSVEKKTYNILEVKRLSLQKRITEEGGKVSCEEYREQEMDKVIQKLTDVHINNNPDVWVEHARLMDLEARYKEQRELEQKIFGSRKALSRDEYRMIYELTGMDVDGRRAIIAKMAPTLDKKVTTFVAFAKALPGFSQLSMDDQIKLIKATSMERWVFLFGCWMNTDEFLLVYPYNPDVVFGEDEFAIFADDHNCSKHETIAGLRHIYDQYQRLELTDKETIVAAALAMMNADAVLSSAGQAITSASVEYLSETLQYLLHKNHEPEELTFCKVIAIFTSLREYKEFYREVQLNFIEDGEGLGVPQVFIELFT